MKRKAMTMPCEALVEGESFLQIMEARLIGQDQEMAVSVEVMNLHFEPADSIEAEAIFYDVADTPLHSQPILLVFDKAAVLPGKIGSAGILRVGQYFPGIKKIRLKIASVVFSSGHLMEFEYRLEHAEWFAFLPLPPSQKSHLQRLAGDDAYNLPIRHKKNWRCVCGYFSGIESKICLHCDRSQEEALAFGDALLREAQKALPKLEVPFAEQEIELKQTLPNPQTMSPSSSGYSRDKLKVAMAYFAASIALSVLALLVRLWGR